MSLSRHAGLPAMHGGVHPIASVSSSSSSSRAVNRPLWRHRLPWPRSSPSAAAAAPPLLHLEAAAPLVACVGAIAARRPRRCRLDLTSCCAAMFPKASPQLPEEEKMLLVVKKNPRHHQDDIARVLRAVESFKSPAKNLKLLDGDWLVKWNSNYGASGRKTLLKFASHNALPDSMVSFTRSYVRVAADAFHSVQMFKVPGQERTNAGLVLSGARAKGLGSSIQVQLDTARILPTKDWDAELSAEMVRAEGLERYQKGVQISVDPMTLDVEYLSTALCIHRQSETGVHSLLVRCDKPIPFGLD